MSPQMNGEPREKAISAADRAKKPVPPLPEAGQLPVLDAIKTDGLTQTPVEGGDKLAPLFSKDAATDFRSRWDVVQRGFVDDPREAVSAADELVVQVIKSLSDSFANQRSDFDAGHETAGTSSTENLRLALRRYRSFFERLLSI